MIVQRWVAFALGAVLFGASAEPAELPAQRGQPGKSKKAEHVTPCNIAGVPGVLAADGVCVRLSGYVSSEFSASQRK